MIDEQDIPWQDLAFRTIHLTLEQYLADKAAIIAQGKNIDDFANYPMRQITLDEIVVDELQ
ncbi:hypothetical protein AO379_1434 [Moraxella catarrhalis]|nr:hypothetical protein AO379_1434 [Moraxella catarrhalis]